MDSDRNFLKRSIILSRFDSISSRMLKSVQKVPSIDPEEGNTYFEEEPLVILMQENKSFNHHCFGVVKGIRD